MTGRPTEFPRRVGRACEVALLTATPAGRAWRQQRRKFWVARRPRWLAQTAFKRRNLARELKRLDFIHAGGWYALDRFPRLDGAIHESGDYRWVVFLSNFNGGWHPYLDTFLEGFGHGIYSLWSRSIGFPFFPGPGSRYSLQSWVETRVLPAGHFYAAYPGATTHDVRAALRVSRELRAFAIEQSRADPAPDDATLTRAFERLVARLQHCLGASEAPPESWYSASPPGVNGFTGVVSVAPIQPGREDEVVELLNALDGVPAATPGPFAQVSGTHFARFVIIDRRKAGVHPREQVVLRNSWLLFAAEFDAYIPPWEDDAARAEDAELLRYFGAIEGHAQLRGLWDLCQARDRSPSLAEYLLPTVVPRLADFRDVPDSTVTKVVRALHHAQLLRQAVVDARPDAMAIRALIANVLATGHQPISGG